MVEKKRQLIIVIDESTRTYGELLLALTLMSDDVMDGEGNYSDSGRVGTRDGSVDAAVWDENHYKANQYKIGSSARIIFLGDLQTAKPIAANINFENEFEKYGVLFGSLGNKAVIDVDKKALVSNKEGYSNFVKDYTDFVLSVNKEFAEANEISETEFYSDKFNEKAKAIQDSINHGAKELVNSIEATAELLGIKKVDSKEKEPEQVEEKKNRAIAGKVIAAMLMPFDSAVGIKAGIAIAQSNAEIVDQQFRCGIIKFYIDELEAFLG